MTAVLAPYCLVVLAVCLVLSLYRILRGPSVADRVAATDLMTSCIMAIVLVAGMIASTRVFMDVVLALALLGFFGTVAFAKYLIAGRAID